MNTLRRSALTLLIGTVAWLCLGAAETPAQSPPPPGATTARRDPSLAPAPRQPSGQSAVVVESAHNYWMEAGIFAVLAGGALFLICRSAGRV